MAHCIACMPPRLPPIIAAYFCIPKWSESMVWLLTQSSTATEGKSEPYISPVSGLILDGPVLP